MPDTKSYRQLLRSSYIIGGSSIINIFVGLLRIKIAAVLLGPSGVGLIGILQSLMATASSIAGMGFGTSGTRQIAEAVGREDITTVQLVRRALFLGTFILALAGGGIFWLIREALATHVLGDKVLASIVGGLAIGVMLMVAAVSQTSLLTGLRSVGDLARVNVFSALLSCLIGVIALFLWGQNGILVFILAVPLSNFIVGHWYVSQLPKVSLHNPTWPNLFKQWQILARLGITFMLAGLIATLTQLLIRTMVQRELGTEALGNFQAAWQISMTYLGFILAAMGTDYYPRLTAVINDHSAANRMVNEQTEIALLLGGSIILAILGLTPWLIELLYSNQFHDAANILRWQILGDIFKLASFPLGFILLAAGDGRSFLISESIGFGILAGLTWLGLPWFGIEATGIAFLCMYLVYLPIVYWLAMRRTSFKWTVVVWWHALILFLTSLCVTLLAIWIPILGAFIGILAALCWSMHALMRLSRMSVLTGPIGHLGLRLRAITKSDKFDF
jgi:O-antigen/teichoic acid export membrane protein